MSETTETVTIMGEAITASLLVWRRFKRAMPGTVERLYEINPGLARQGPYLPLGAVVKIPIPPPAASQDVAPVRLWG